MVRPAVCPVEGSRLRHYCAAHMRVESFTFGRMRCLYETYSVFVFRGLSPLKNITALYPYNWSNMGCYGNQWSFYGQGWEKPSKTRNIIRDSAGFVPTRPRDTTYGGKFIRKFPMISQNNSPRPQFRYRSTLLKLYFTAISQACSRDLRIVNTGFSH